jgi:hypothetical protein
MQPPLAEDEAACDGSTRGVRRWGFGRIACGVEGESATVAWTDSRSDLLGIARGVGPDIDALYGWWEDEAKPLGRVAATGASSEPGLDRLVRVPGAPDDVICTNLAEPIVDSHGRTWGIERVRFIGRPEYERVVFDLRRRGRIDPDGRTEVTVDRTPVKDVPSEVRGASRPGRGRTALVVRMQGVTEAPALQAYRPQGVDLVKELSIVRNDRSHTAILSLNGDACYQVRIPVFGPSASGEEDRAEIFIDIPR